MNAEEYKVLVDELIELLDEGVYIVDREGVGIHYNKAMAGTEKVHVRDVLGKKFHEAFPDFEQGESTIYRALIRDQATRNAQQTYKNLYGKEIFEQMWKWLKDRGCANLVSPHLLEQYSMAMARWIQLEKITSEYGFISKHPTTGAAISSPFVTMAQGYLKQANLLFQQIFSIVSDNCTSPVTGNPQDDIMEQLLGK